MGTVYLVSSNGKMSKEGEALVVRDYDGTKTTLPLHTIGQLIVIGTVEISGQALRLLMKYSIETVFVSKNGRYDGKLVFEDAKNVFLRQKQYDVLHNEGFCIITAKSIVRGKLRNEYLFMQRIGRKLEKDAFITQQVQKLASILEKLEKASTIDEIRGYEGFAATLYFSVLGRNVTPEWVVFKGRNKNPPRDPMNAVLSFLYTLLAYRVDALIVSEGLDNSVGILHALSYGRKSLVFDLIEEYRTPLVDTLTCAMFNMGVLNKDDFRSVLNTEESREECAEVDTDPEGKDIPGEFEKAVLLTQEGIRKVVVQFERKLQEEHLYEPLGKRIDYKRIMHEQVKMYKRFIMGLEEAFKPVVIS